MPRRQDMIQQLDASRQTPYDLLIIGGGITGSGAARDAARRGLRVALVEMNDLAFGTSSRSSKLVHGGLRYLEQGEFSLVFEAVTERRILMEIAPHLVNPLSFVFPVFKHSRRGVFTVNVGMWLYDGLSLFRSPKIHRNLSRKQVIQELPMLKQEGLRGAPLFYDCATDDARLTLESALDATRHGATVATWCKVLGFVRDGDGRIIGARVHDEQARRELEVRAHAVINATGPWSDRTRSLAGSGAAPRLRPTKGVHVVVDYERLPVQHAVVCFHPRDGRVLFAIPWGDRTYIGTTDTDYTDDPGEVCADRADVRYLIEASNDYFPAAALTEDDIIATWAGVRPLISEEGAAGESSVSREHDIRVDPDGLITIAGGKLTTYRKMAEEVVDKALGMLMVTGHGRTDLREARTATEPLPGAVGWPEDDDHEAVARQVLDAADRRIGPDTARLLADTYGMRGLDVAARVAADPLLGARLVPDRPEILAQVDFAVTEELAETVRDVLIRRTQLFFRDHDQGLGASDAVAERMAELLGWSEDRMTREVLAYQAEVARSRRWRDAPALPEGDA
ncbi:MAG: glycerol-3-phosphate dehydrogenase [Deltaproteobacteria bacterium]|nr:MAG: glycerol-3-phosphate dehydrogenase [Deltaproteobacteria bacterium]